MDDRFVRDDPAGTEDLQSAEPFAEQSAEGAEMQAPYPEETPLNQSNEASAPDGAPLDVAADEDYVPVGGADYVPEADAQYGGDLQPTREDGHFGVPENTENAEPAAPVEETSQGSPEVQAAESAGAPASKPVPKQHRVRDAIVITVTVILIVLLLPLLCINLTLIIKSSINPDVPPDIFGTAFLAVEVDSMEGDAEDCFGTGDLICIDLLTPEEIRELGEGSIVSFRSSDGVYVSLRIVEVTKNQAGETTAFGVIGDNDVIEGVTIPYTVSPESVIGVVTNSIDGLGGFAMFLRTPVGVLVFVGIPVVLYVLYDIIRITVESRKKRAAEEARLREKDEEIARLKAMVSVPGAGEVPAQVPAEAEVPAEVAEAAEVPAEAAVEAPAEDSEVPAEMPAEVPEGELAPEEAPAEEIAEEVPASVLEAAEPPVEG